MLGSSPGGPFPRHRSVAWREGLALEGSNVIPQHDPRGVGSSLPVFASIGYLPPMVRAGWVKFERETERERFRLRVRRSFCATVGVRESSTFFFSSSFSVVVEGGYPRGQGRGVLRPCGCRTRIVAAFRCTITRARVLVCIAEGVLYKTPRTATHGSAGK